MANKKNQNCEVTHVFGESFNFYFQREMTKTVKGKQFVTKRGGNTQITSNFNHKENNNK